MMAAGPDRLQQRARLADAAGRHRLEARAAQILFVEQPRLDLVLDHQHRQTRA